jgi:hypothetical protein
MWRAIWAEECRREECCLIPSRFGFGPPSDREHSITQFDGLVNVGN